MPKKVQIADAFVLVEGKEEVRFACSDQRAGIFPRLEVTDHRAASLGHAVHLAPHHGESVFQRDRPQHLAGERIPWPPIPTMTYCILLSLSEDATIAPCGQTDRHTPQETQNLRR